jgi:hypothetical protein
LLRASLPHSVRSIVRRVEVRRKAARQLGQRERVIREVFRPALLEKIGEDILAKVVEHWPRLPHELGSEVR